VEISPDGQITDSVIDTLEFDTSLCYYPKIVQVQNNVYAITYTGQSNYCYLNTLTINPDGQISDAIIDVLIIDSSRGYNPKIASLSENYYAITYEGPDRDGFLKTVEIQTDGQITDTIIDLFEYNPIQARYPSFFLISSDLYAIFYSGAGTDGFVSTGSFEGGAYTLDIEVTWGDLPSRQFKFLSIYAGDVSSEILKIDYWDGSTWNPLISDILSGWNTIDVSPYLAGSSFTIRFRDSVQIADLVQDQWEIDFAYLNLFD
jgi:hypothetical protein